MRLRRKLLLILIGFALIAGIVLDVSGNALLRSSLRSLASERLEKESALVADLLPPPPGFEDSVSLTARLEPIADHLEVRITLIGIDGGVLADTEVPVDSLSRLDNHIGRPEVVEALERGTGRARRFSATLQTEMSYFARVLHGPDGPAGVLRVALPTSRLEAGAGPLRAAAVTMAILVFILFSAIAYAITRRISAPVERVAREADLVASGRYDRPIAFRGGGAELAALTGSLERMRRSLMDQIAQAEGERRMMDSVLSGMREGILAVDMSGRVILANASLRRAFRLEEARIEGRPLAAVIRDPDAGKAFSRALSERMESRVSLTLRFPLEREFEVMVAPLDSPEGGAVGAIGVFFDVTRLKALESMRRDFVADLSHEMRTPLTSLDAAVENLLGLAGSEEEDRAAFLGIARRNVERIKALIDDLTDLSLIETGAIHLEKEPLSMAEMVSDAVTSLRSKADARRIEIRTNVPAGFKVLADRRRLDQILVNVIDNAIKFNRSAGVVEIACNPVDGGAELTVDDTGNGLLPADHERIFRRFYRIDRGRSRQAGGTGLGLAIVKHLMRLHGGSVRAENRASGGTRIVLLFPGAEDRAEGASPAPIPPPSA